MFRDFSRDIILGGNCFCGERKCEEYPKNERNLSLFGGEIQNLRGEPPPPPKALKKNTGCVPIVVLQLMIQKSAPLCGLYGSGE